MTEEPVLYAIFPATLTAGQRHEIRADPAVNALYQHGDLSLILVNSGELHRLKAIEPALASPGPRG